MIQQLGVWLDRSPLIAILRGVKPSEVEDIGAVLYEARILAVEVPLNSPDPLASVRRLAQRFGDRMLVGAGTVTDQAVVEQVADAGGRLIVTPHADPAIVERAKAAGLIAVPGFFNPTEAFALLRAGADGIKLFPANVQGTLFLTALRSVLPADAIVVPVGGVDARTIPSWIMAGARGVGAGTSLYKPGDRPEQVAARSRALMDAIASVAPAISEGGLNGDGRL